LHGAIDVRVTREHDKRRIIAVMRCCLRSVIVMCLGTLVR